MSDKRPLPITDKLVEFAKETVVQEQMTSSMNSIIANMRIPGADNPMHPKVKPLNAKDDKQDEN